MPSSNSFPFNNYVGNYTADCPKEEKKKSINIMDGWNGPQYHDLDVWIGLVWNTLVLLKWFVLPLDRNLFD